jgi:predicted TIM-barrel fold metal-dependent hydrolase
MAIDDNEQGERGALMGLDVAGRYRYPAPNQEWLHLHAEEALEPHLPIVDAHHHLWQEPGNHYLLNDLIADVATGHNIVATVFVQCHYGYREAGPDHLRPVGETERIEAVRREARARCAPQLCAGIVGFADLLAEDVLDEVLDAHLAASPDHFSGIRQSVSRDSHFPDGIVLRPAPAGMLSDPVFRRGVRKVARRNLAFDAMLYHEQIPELTALAGDVDDATIILDHYGTPLGVGHYRGQERETFTAWRRDIVELAQCPNVHIKLGGLGMIITGAEHHLGDRPPTSSDLAARWRPYFDVCAEAFGARRCLFESNFPVDKAMYSYAVLWNAFKTLAAGASAAEKADLFTGTAARLYRLALDQPLE